MKSLRLPIFFRYLKKIQILILFLPVLSLGNNFSNNSQIAGSDSIERTENYDLLGKYFLQPLIYLYQELVSNFDGDNCPFEPSCSNFFLEGVRRTNLIEAILIFSDRLIRDFNVFNRKDYPLSKNGKLLDPIEKYLLEQP
ncbi:MAG: membrane protein insertion efficiency factor YidD [Ignavibacteria bacterium]|nr:membrane protein insertion efficiency factor YidD [Ignavibacteria bacterium]